MYACGGALLAAGAGLGSWLGFALMGAGYGLLNSVMLATEARLQALITGPARATVTSVGGVGTELTALTVYLAFGIGQLLVDDRHVVRHGGRPHRGDRRPHRSSTTTTFGGCGGLAASAVTCARRGGSPQSPMTDHDP